MKPKQKPLSPIRQLFQKLLRQRITTEAEKRELAQHLGKSLSTINKMLYEGKIGLDVWIGAMEFCYNLDVVDLSHYIETQVTKASKKKMTRYINTLNSPGAKAWNQVGKKLTDDEKIYYSGMIKYSLKANRSAKAKKS